MTIKNLAPHPLTVLVEDTDGDHEVVVGRGPGARTTRVRVAVPIPPSGVVAGAREEAADSDPVVVDAREQILLTGDLPSPSNPPAGCRFHTRCPWRQDTRCDTERPALRVVEIDGVDASHRVACHWAEGIAAGQITPHSVRAELVEQVDTGGTGGSLMGPASVEEAL